VYHGNEFLFRLERLSERALNQQYIYFATAVIECCFNLFGSKMRLVLLISVLLRFKSKYYAAEISKLTPKKFYDYFGSEQSK
jgi:hypothetical protein